VDIELWRQHGVLEQDDAVEGGWASTTLRAKRGREKEAVWWGARESGAGAEWNWFWQSKLGVNGDADAFGGKSAAKLKLGLFSYPVLQAADILVHRYAHSLLRPVRNA
jgi:tryptophanyl-tRNA synthetase